MPTVLSSFYRPFYLVHHWSVHKRYVSTHFFLSENVRGALRGPCKEGGLAKSQRDYAVLFCACRPGARLAGSSTRPRRKKATDAQRHWGERSRARPSDRREMEKKGRTRKGRKKEKERPENSMERPSWPRRALAVLFFPFNSFFGFSFIRQPSFLGQRDGERPRAQRPRRRPGWRSTAPTRRWPA